MVGLLDSAVVSPVLVGRDRELDAIDQLRAAVRAGHGRTLVIAGEAGIGKSRLIDETRRRFVDAGEPAGLALRGSCFEVDQDYPFAPILDLLRGAESGSIELLSAAERADLRGILPEINQLRPGSTSLDQDGYRLFRLISSSLARLASRRPLLLVVEDLHWCDDATLKLLLHLSRNVENSQILLLLSYRTDEVQPSLRQLLSAFDRERRATELVLEPLERRNIDAMLRSVFEQDQPIRTDFLDMIGSLTDGNPFFIEEVLRSLIAAGDIYFADGYWTRKETSELRIPRSVHDAVWRRASGLRREEREILSLAAVTGRHFDFGVLQDVTGIDESTLLRYLRNLIDSQLIYEETTDRFAFRHALTRQAIYTELLGRERMRLHRVVAEAIERRGADSADHHVADLAYHYDAAGVWEKTSRYARRAGERAEALFAPKAAADHFTRALRAEQHMAHEPDLALYQRRAQAYTILGQFDLADQDYNTVLRLARDQGRRDIEWAALLGLGELWTGRDYDRSIQYFQDSLELASAHVDSRAVARSLVQLANWQVNAELADEAERSLTAALELFEDLDDRKGVAEARDLLGVVEDINGNQRLMRERYEIAEALYRVLDDRKGVVSVLSNISTTGGGYLVFETISLAGGIASTEAESIGNDVINLAREIDWYAGESFALLTSGLHYRAQGNYARALEMGRRGLEIAEQIDHREWMTASRVLLGSIYIDLLDFEQGSDWYRQAASLAAESASVLWKRGTTGFLASARVLEGRLDEAEAILQGCDDPITTNTIGSRLVWLARAKLALTRGDAFRSLEIVDVLLAQARNSSGEQDIPALARHRGESLIALGRFDEAERSLRAARLTGTKLGLRPLLWQVHRLIGLLLQRTGRSEEAETEFANARAVIEAMSATVPEAVLRDAFRTRALALIPELRDPVSDLTPREREVAELLATGISNREIAEALFIGERTVETHVGNILAKLGFTSRAQVAAWMAGNGAEDAG